MAISAEGSVDCDEGGIQETQKVGNVTVSSWFFLPNVVELPSFAEVAFR